MALDDPLDRGQADAQPREFVLAVQALEKKFLQSLGPLQAALIKSTPV